MSAPFLEDAGEYSERMLPWYDTNSSPEDFVQAPLRGALNIAQSRKSHRMGYITASALF